MLFGVRGSNLSRLQPVHWYYQIRLGFIIFILIRLAHYNSELLISTGKMTLQQHTFTGMQQLELLRILRMNVMVLPWIGLRMNTYIGLVEQ